MTIMTSWTIYALVIETPGSELGIFWILVIQIVLCSISMWHDCETQQSDEEVHDPQPQPLQFSVEIHTFRISG